MEIDVARLKNVFRYTAKNLKALDTELLAYRTVFHAMKAFLGPEARLDEALEVARKSDQLREKMDQKYDALLETLLVHIDQVSVDRGLEELLQNWKPEGPAN